MRRGDILIVAIPGDYGKPRPAVIVQSDYLIEAGAYSLVICPVTSHLEDAETFRLTIEPAPENGLKVTSQIMTDKIFTIPRTKAGQIIGRLDDEMIVRLNRTLAFVIGLA